jgi:tetratricopeptide (TPR) repeat protein
MGEALATCRLALTRQPGHPASLALQGRILLSQGRAEEAIEALSASVQADPLPETLWALSEALRESDRLFDRTEFRARDPGEGHMEGHQDILHAEARELGNLMAAEAARRDPLGYSVFLSTHGHNPGEALRLARRERETRGDAFTHDALAWAHFAAGDLGKARRHMDTALSGGIRDARLHFHAGMIALASGDRSTARGELSQAHALHGMLMPSEARRVREARRGLETAPAWSRAVHRGGGGGSDLRRVSIAAAGWP